MNYNNPIPRSINNVIIFVTHTLFVLFSFSYLFCLQCDVLSEAQYVFSNGVTSYSRFWGALIITILLEVVQMFVARLTRFNGRWYAWNFFPSILLLMVITSLDRESIEDFSFGQWLWAFPLLLLLFTVFVVMKNKVPGDSIDNGDYSNSKYLWPNCLVLFLMMVWCGANASADDVFMYELKAERLLLEEDYEGASRVGEKSLMASPRLNELRMYALAQQGLLGEKLFDYPQLYGSESLMMMDDTVTHLHRFTCKDIQAALGAWANESIGSFGHYLELLQKNPSTRHNPLLGDYVLCDKLLQKDLRGFYRMVKRYYRISEPINVLTLPKAYREAMLLQARSISRDSLNAFADTLMLDQYRAYRLVQESDTNDVAKATILRRDFGKTLWWYLDN